MEIVCSSQTTSGGPLTDAIPTLAQQGVTSIEVGLNQPETFDYQDPVDVDRLLQDLQDYGIRVNSVHAPFGKGRDISSPDDETHEHGVDGLIDSIEFARLVESRIVIVHPSDMCANGRDRRVERARGVLREVSKVAEEAGIVLAVENLPPGYLASTPDELLEIIDGTGSHSVRVCFDTGHANLSGDALSIAETLLPITITLHVHDNDGINDEHLFPGKGTIDWKKFGRAYREADSSASLVIETKSVPEHTWMQSFQELRSIFDA